jgi:hypothetical protein
LQVSSVSLIFRISYSFISATRLVMMLLLVLLTCCLPCYCCSMHSCRLQHTACTAGTTVAFTCFPLSLDFCLGDVRVQAADKPDKLPADVAADRVQQQQHTATPQQPAAPQLLQLQNHSQQQQQQQQEAVPAGELAVAQPVEQQQQVFQLDAIRARYEVPWDIW